MNRKDMLCQLMALNFSLIDLNLYLDTHPGDCDTIAVYKDLEKEYNALKKEFEEKYGTLTPGTIRKTEWTWISDPWPWEKMFNQEV